MSRRFQAPTSSFKTHLLLACAIGALVSSPALADCTADASGLNVTCTGTSPSYINTQSGVSLSADSTAAVTAPVTLGTNAVVTNAGSITTSTTSPALQTGSDSQIVNNGTISSTGAASTAVSVIVGDHSTITNNGTLTAVSGVAVAQFGRGGTFINNASATAVVNGEVNFGLNLNSDVAHFSNYNTQYGYSGIVTSSGNTDIYNDGLFSGNFNQTATMGTVSFVNDTEGTFSGNINTGDQTSLVNNGTLSLGLSNIGTLQSGTTSFVNNGTLSIGTTSVPTSLTVYGSFAQSSSGTLNVSLISSSTGSPVAGSSYSQVAALGTNGTATLAGTLHVQPTGGFYPTGSTYDIVVADQGITGNFSNVTGNVLPFITFTPVGIVDLANGQQAYELEAVRNQTYAQALAGVGTANQLAIATGFQPLVAYATANPTSDAATLVGEVDILPLDQARTFFDELSPAGYAGYATAIQDQARQLQRQLFLRLDDHNSPEAQKGWWLTGGQTFHRGTPSNNNPLQSMTTVMGGYDFNGPRYVIGASAAYTHDSLSISTLAMNGSTSETQLSAYGAYHLGPLVVSGQAGYMLGSIGSTKTITIGTTTTTSTDTAGATTTTTTPTYQRTATASSNDHLFNATATLGFDLSTGGIALKPFIGAMVQQGSISGFTESGATIADLTVNRIGIDRTDLLAGATLTRSRGKWRPYVGVTYRSELGSGQDGAVSAYLNDDPTNLFTVYGPVPSKNEVDVDAGLNIVFMDEGTIFVGYQGTYRDSASTQGVMAGIRLQF
ncbi:MAG: autotransporter domain-containing protein [Sphingomonadaceae bacterium]